jgi:hypothetical protein
MAGDGGKDRSGASKAHKAFNPLWLVDSAGASGFVSFVVGILFASKPSLALLRETGLVFMACWLIVRSIDFILRHRDGREGQRRELLRRLALLNDALLELRKSLSRDNTRKFLDRRKEFADGAKLAQGALNDEEAKLVKSVGEFTDDMARELAATVRGRAQVNGETERLRREIERAARRGDLDQHDADDLIDVVNNAVGVLDDAIFAEWNADHFGRLGSELRHFTRELDRYKSATAGEIERRGRELFDDLQGHVRQKVELVDRIEEWSGMHRKLEMRMSGLPIPKPKPKVKGEEEKPKPRPSERFPMLVVRNEDDAEDFGGHGGSGGGHPGIRHRLPAAND